MTDYSKLTIEELIDALVHENAYNVRQDIAFELKTKIIGVNNEVKSIKTKCEELLGVKL